jgi:sortase A
MRYVRVFGKLLISLGFGVLLFVAWTLWGTGLYTSQQQDLLEDAFAARPPVAVSEDDEGRVKVPTTFSPGAGEGVFRLRIPRIDLKTMVVEGVGTDDLRKGPGHYPECRRGFERPFCTDFEEMWPGENGRVIVSGHRTTYGGPFYNLNELTIGDEIITDTDWGTFTYEVTESEIVRPDSLAIAIQKDRAEIVLTTCNPRFSASQRLIVYARLVT